MSAFTANIVLIASIIMGIMIFAAIFIGLHFSKKSAEKFRQQRQKELQDKEN